MTEHLLNREFILGRESVRGKALSQGEGLFPGQSFQERDLSPSPGDEGSLPLGVSLEVRGKTDKKPETDLVTFGEQGSFHFPELGRMVLYLSFDLAGRDGQVDVLVDDDMAEDLGRSLGMVDDGVYGNFGPATVVLDRGEGFLIPEIDLYGNPGHSQD